MKLLKRKYRALNTRHFRNITDEVDIDREALKQVQIALQMDHLNKALQEEERQMFRKFKQSSYLAEMYLQQRSKATWIQLGDDNTKYFFSVIKHKKLQEAITQLHDKDGVIQTNPTDIARVLLEYYESLFGRNEGIRVGNRQYTEEWSFVVNRPAS